MSRIFVSQCNSCGDSRVPVIRSFFEGKTQIRCKICDPDGFETQARIDIESWLRGDPETDRQLGYS